MRISTKGRYAVRALVELATQDSNSPIMLSLIASRQNIPQRYLIQIFSSLRKSGLVHSIRGAKGGFQLGNQPKDITLEDIISSAEGPIELVSCIQGEEENCSRGSDCATQGIWRQVNERVKSVFKSITLEEMVKLHQEQNNCIENNYQI